MTCTLGNLAAYGQTNMKRLLAYSTIAHAGYLMMAVAAAVAMVGVDPAGARDAVSATAFYLGTYLCMNLGAFAIVAPLRNRLRSEEIDAYAGLVRSSPGISGDDISDSRARLQFRLPCNVLISPLCAT